MFDLKSVFIKREQLASRLYKALAHLNKAQVVFIIASHISITDLEKIVEQQEKNT